MLSLFRHGRIRSAGFAILCWPAAAIAASSPEQGRSFVQNFTARDFRGRPTLFAPTTTPDGMVAFANFGAVALYDGRSWQSIAASDRPILRVFPREDGSYLLGLVEDFGRLARDAAGHWSFTSYTASLPAEIHPLGQVWTIAVEGRDVFFSTSRHIVRLSGGDPSQAHTWTPADIAAKFDMPLHTNAAIVPVLTRIAGKLHWFQRGTGLYEYRGGDFIAVRREIEELRSPQLSQIYGRADGSLHLVMYDGTIRTFDAQGRPVDRPQPLVPLLQGQFVRAACLMPGGGVVITTQTSGVFWLDEEGRILRHITHETGLDTDQFIGALADTEGNVWLASQRGASRVELEPQLTLFDPINGAPLMGFEQVHRHKGTLYAYSQEGFHRLVPAVSPGDSARWKRVETGQDIVRRFIADGENLLLGTVAGLSRLDGEKVTLLVRMPGQVLSHHFLGPDRLLLGYDNGLRLLARREGQWETLLDVPGINGPVLSLCSGPGEDEVWVGTLAMGLLRLAIPATATRPEETNWRAYGAAEGLDSKTKNVLVERHRSRDLIICPDGTYSYDRRTDRIRRVTDLRPGERNFRNIELATEAPDGRLFVQGVLDGPGPEERAFGWFDPTSEGYKWHPFPARYRERLGPTGAGYTYLEESPAGDVLWVCGSDATLRLELAQPAVVPASPRTIIRSAQREGVSLVPHAEPLSYSTSPVRFGFASPSFLNQAGIRFQSRLIGYEDRWSPPDARTEVEFTNLGGGRYTFEVRAVDADGRTGPAATFDFAITPPWHRTPLAYSAYAALALLGVAGFVRLRLAAARREQARLERLVAERTAELRAEKERADLASRAKSTFLAHMSHELRTPLNGIIGYAQVLLKDAAVAGRQRERVNIVHASGQHLLRMINEVLDFSKIEAGKIERQDEPFHFGQLLRELAVAHEAAAQARGLTFTLAATAELPLHVRSDAQKLRQILDNLLSNAVKFTRQGGVTLRLEPAGDGVWRFTVADTGVGMTADDVARLFQPFEQARTGRPTEPGTGLGLAITQRLVRLLGGELRVESEPGRGSRFDFALPLPAVAAPSRASRSPFPVAGYAGPRRRILVVDDNATNRSLLADLLAPLGFEIAEFESAEEMLAVPAGDLRGDLAFLDVKLPGIDGLELARRLRARPGTARLPIVFTSASVLTFDRATASAIGCPDFLPKPFAETQLTELLTRLLDLDWERAAPAPPPASAGAGSPRRRLEQLLTLADTGDVGALRQALGEALREHPGDALLKQVESAVASYQLEAARQLLRTALG